MMVGRRALLRLGLAGGAAVLATRSGRAQETLDAGAPVPGAVLEDLRRMQADPDLDGVQLRLWTTESGTDRLAVIRYLLDVQATLAHQPQVVFETIRESDLAGLMRRARDPDSRVPMPHVVNTGADGLMALDAMGLLDRGQAADVLDGLDRAAFLPGALAALRRADGTLAGVPFHGWPQMIWMRRDWLRRDLDMEPPRTVDALRRAAHGLHDPETGRRGVILGTAGDFYTQQCFMMVARAFGAAIFAPSASPEQAEPVLALDTRAMIAALEAYADLARAAGPGRLTWRARDYYLQGRAGMLFYSTFLMDDLVVPGVAADSLTGRFFDDLEGATFDPRLVRETEPVGTLTVDGPAVPRDAIGAFSSINGIGLTGTGAQAEQAAARALVRFLFRPDAYVAWLHMAPGGMIPVVRGVLERDAFMRDRLGVFQTFGRAAIRRFGEALTVPSTFSTVGFGAAAHADPRAALLYTDGVVGRMVVRVLEGAATPLQSALTAQGEALDLLRTRAGR
jgi:multiple sugar transport system substrate-binding protein